MRVKRLLASLLAATMTLSVGATAFAANAKPGNGTTTLVGGINTDAYGFSQDTVFFDVKGVKHDIYKVNADTAVVKKVTTFSGATEYFLKNDTEFVKWTNMENGAYHLKNDTTNIPTAKAVWTAQYKAPATGEVLPADKPTMDEVKSAIQNAGTKVVLGDALYVVEAASGKMGTAPVNAQASVALAKDVKAALANAGKSVSLNTPVASLELPANALVDSFEAKVAQVDGTVGTTNTVSGALVYDLTVNNGQSHDFGTKVTVSLPVALPTGETQAYVYYVENNEPVYQLDQPVAVENGVLTFKTNHFSQYAVSTVSNPKVPTETEYNAVTPDNPYTFSKDTVYFDVDGAKYDIYDINSNPDLTKKIGTFAGAVEYFRLNDTEFSRWLNVESGEYHFNDDTKILNEKAVWTAQYKAPTTATTKDTKVQLVDVASAVETAKITGKVALGDSLYVVSAVDGKMGTAAAGSTESIALTTEVKNALAEAKLPVVLGTGVASLELPFTALNGIDSFKAVVEKANETVGVDNKTVSDALVYDLSVNNGPSYNFGTKVLVTVPVVLPADATAYVYFMDNNGNLVYRLDKAAAIDAKEGTLSFETTHFSKYVISAELNTTVPTETDYNNNNGGGNGGGGNGGGGNGGGGSSSSGSSSSHAKPQVSVNGVGGKITADNKGNVTITPDEGYQVKDVTVNGKSVGAVLTLTGLKYTDKVVVTFEKIPTEWVNPFTDVAETAWYYDAVRYAYENKLFNGVSNTEFAPEVNMTRAMLVTVLYRLNGATETGTSSFTDVPTGMFYTDAVAWAQKNGIVNGISETEFAPDQNVTREQIAAILARYAKFTGKTLPAGTLDFPDADQISEFAKADVASIQAAGIVKGRDNGMFAPLALATRAEVATMLMRYIEYVG